MDEAVTDDIRATADLWGVRIGENLAHIMLTAYAAETMPRKRVDTAKKHARLEIMKAEHTLKGQFGRELAELVAQAAQRAFDARFNAVRCLAEAMPPTRAS